MILYLLFFPKARKQEDDNGHAFEAAHEHEEGAEPEGGGGEVDIAPESTGGSQTGPVAGEAAYGGTDGFRRAHATEHQSHDTQHQRASKNDEDDHHVVGNMSGDGPAVEAHRVNDGGMQAVAKDGAGVAEEDEHAHALEASRCRTGHTTADGQDEQQEGNGYGPQRVVGHYRACGGQGTDGLHGT